MQTPLQRTKQFLANVASLARKEHLEELMVQIDFQLGDRYIFSILEEGEKLFLQGSYVEEDTYTHRPAVQYTRKWFISPDATDSQVVQTAFKCALTSAEHRCREAFQYKEVRVYGPHYDVEDLVKLGKERQWKGAPKKDYKD